MNEKIIIANCGEKLEASLRQMGYDPNTIFFKRDSKTQFDSGGKTHEIVTLYHSGADDCVVEEYRHLRRLHDADHRHVVKPIFDTGLSPKQ